MNNPTTKSSIIDMKGSTLAVLLWIVALLTSLTTASFLLVVGCIAILLFERNSDYFRNHVSQLLALTIVYSVIDILFTLIFGPSSIFIFRFLRFITNLLVIALRFVLVLLKASFCFIGLARALDQKDLKLPFFGNFGISLEQAITPDSFR